MNYKAKPCFNFQSIEFEMEINTKEDWDRFIAIYTRCYKALRAIAPEDPSKAKKTLKPVKVEDPATESQIAIMEKHGIDIPANCSRKQASKLIEKSIKEAKEAEEDIYLPDDDDDMPF